MKTLTIITVIALPMTIVTSFFGMNFDPDRIHGWGWLLTHPAGFWLSLGVVGVMVAVLLYLFHRKRWI
jgi:magnesium transporter